VYYYWPGHPAASAGSRLHEHRAIGYELWGEAIRGHHIDHIDNNPLNNDPDNLQCLSVSDHFKKTQKHESGNAFKRWCNEYHPEIVEEWERERDMPDAEARLRKRLSEPDTGERFTTEEVAARLGIELDAEPS